jgi:ParB family chromosome partitioning protein
MRWAGSLAAGARSDADGELMGGLPQAPQATRSQLTNTAVLCTVARMAARKKTSATSARGARRPRRARGKLAPGAQARGLEAAQVALAIDSPEAMELAALVRAVGGAPIGAYHEPLSGRPLMLASLPLAAVQPTPFQRDLSPTHTKRLAQKIEETAAFLDPLIVVRGEDGKLWTPNGRHRLAAAKVLGLRQITALISPDETLAYRILALNTEKAHNLRDRSLEVIRMARSLAKRQKGATEAALAAEFESPELLTLGVVYEQSSRFAGGAYSAFLKKVDRFSDRPLAARLRGAAVGDRRAGEEDHRGSAAARLQITVPAQLRRRAHQPRALPQSQEGRRATADAARAGSDAHDGRGARLQAGVGFQRGSRLGGGGSGRAGVAGAGRDCLPSPDRRG